MIDEGLLISNVLAGVNYLCSIQFPPFPERGLGRDRIADLHNARKVRLWKEVGDVGYSAHCDVIAASFGVYHSYSH